MAKGVKGSGPTEDIPTRTTMIMRPSLLKKLKYIALVDQTTQTAIVEQLLEEYVAKWEKKNGPVPTR